MTECVCVCVSVCVAKLSNGRSYADDRRENDAEFAKHEAEETM